LFFFCSGFTLFLGTKLRFDNWYKKRIQRIFPTLIAISLLSAGIFGQEENVLEVFTGQKFWFLNCILCYYALFYPILWYGKHLRALFGVILVAVVVIWFTLYDFTGKGIFYGHDDFRRVFYFLFMMQGALMGVNRDKYVYHGWHPIAFVVCVLAWYGALFFTTDTNWQILSMVPLLGVCRYGYLTCSAPWLGRLYRSKTVGRFMYYIAMLCLEIYVIQHFVITDFFNAIFPLNIPLVMGLIIASAYGLRVVSNFIRQTFEKEQYRWKEVITV
jgi:peptidoglycan/LPS O-acetylase OafA/YrhL